MSQQLDTRSGRFGPVRPLVARACLTAALAWSILLVAPSIGHHWDNNLDARPLPTASTRPLVSSTTGLPLYNHNYEAWDFGKPRPSGQPSEARDATQKPISEVPVQDVASPMHIAALFLLAQAIGQVVNSHRPVSSERPGQASDHFIDRSLLLAPLSATIVVALFTAIATAPFISLLALLTFRVIVSASASLLASRIKSFGSKSSSHPLYAALFGMLALSRITTGSPSSWIGAMLLIATAVVGRVAWDIATVRRVDQDDERDCNRRGTSALASSVILILAIASNSASVVSSSMAQSFVLVSLVVLSVVLGNKHELSVDQKPSSVALGAVTDIAAAAIVHFMTMQGLGSSAVSHTIAFACLVSFSILGRFVLDENRILCSGDSSAGLLFGSSKSNFALFPSNQETDSVIRPKLHRGIPTTVSLISLMFLLYVPATQRLDSESKLLTRSPRTTPIFTTHPSSLPASIHKELLLANIKSQSPRSLTDSINKPDTLMTLLPFPAFEEPAVPKTKAARPFWANATVSVAAITVDRFTALSQPAERVKKDQEQWIAGVPTVDKWPQRPLWPSSSFRKSQSQSGAEPKSVRVSLDAIRFGIGSTPDRMDRIAFLYATLGRIPKLNFTLYWTTEDDPDATLVPHASFAMRAAYRLSGARARWPIVLQGEPSYVGRSPHRKWFKMVSHLYETAPEHVRWFAVGDDDTMWLPHVLVDALNRAPQGLDPAKEFVYLGDLTEPLREQRRYGTAQGYRGAGVVVSRALARRVHKYWRACMSGVGRDVWYGDLLLSKCIAYVTSPEIDDLEGAESSMANGVRSNSHQAAAATFAKQNTVASTQAAYTHLTRLPIFNQVDLHEWWPGAMEYFSARFSRAAPATLHHLDRLLPMMARAPNKHYAMLDFWHLMMRMPPEVMFRRFFVALREYENKRSKRSIPARTAVVTHGLHVRVYGQPLTSTEHAVDFDSNKLSHDGEFVGTHWILERQYMSSEPLPQVRNEFTDYWIEAYDLQNDRLVYVDEVHGKRLAVGATCALGSKGTVTDLCAPQLMSNEQLAIVETMAEWQSQVHVWELDAGEPHTAAAGRSEL